MAGTVKSEQLKNGSIGTWDIKNGTLQGADISSSFKNWVRAQAGEDGAKGDKGDTGAKGDTGETGAKGDKGDTGDTGIQGIQGVPGEAGVQGEPGDSYLAGAYYAVAKYDVGNTNEGAIATVACSAVTDVAVSGGVQVVDSSKNTPVSSSFPGRMDWNTNTPKVDRLDGWIVQFGGNAGATADKAPEKVNIWALCVPDLTVPVVTTFVQSEG